MPNPKVFLLSMDYDMSLEEALSVGNFNCHNCNIMEKRFPRIERETGKRDLRFTIYALQEGWMTPEVALKKMKEKNDTPATLLEILAFGRAFPQIQKDNTHATVACGSIWTNGRGLRHVPYIIRRSTKNLDIDLTRYDEPHGRYLAVQKAI